MTYATFEVLGFSISIRNNEYHDDGYVEDLDKYQEGLIEKYGAINNGKRLNNPIGLCNEIITPNKKKIVHIYYIENYGALNTWVRAHEETHALDCFKRLTALEQMLLEDQKVKIDFNKIDEPEVRANLGALYVFHFKGMSLWNVWDKCLFNSDTRKARKLYNQSKLPKKKYFIFGEIK